MTRDEFGRAVCHKMYPKGEDGREGNSVWDYDDPEYVTATLEVCIEIAEDHFRASGDMGAAGIADALRKIVGNSSCVK